MNLHQLRRHSAEIIGFLNHGDCKQTDAGLLIHDDILWTGHFFDENGEVLGKNLITIEGAKQLMDSALGNDPVIGTWYQALHSTGTPVNTWTANQYATSFENKSQTEGYSGVNRPTWTPGQTDAAGEISNLGAEPSYTIVTATTVTFTGAAIVSAQARGSTAGTLLAAANFSTARTQANGDVFKFGYRCKVYN